MVTIVPGYTYSDTSTDPNNEVNASNLATLVDGAVISAIAKSEFSAKTNVITVASSEPSIDEHDVWFDSTLDLMRQKAFDRHVVPGFGTVVYNDSSGYIDQGMALAVKADSHYVEPCQTAEWCMVSGVAYATMASGATGLMIHSGPVQMLMTGDATPGTLFVQSDDAGIMVTHTAYSINDIGYRTYRPGRDVGMAMATALGSGLVTAMAWR